MPLDWTSARGAKRHLRSTERATSLVGWQPNEAVSDSLGSRGEMRIRINGSRHYRNDAENGGCADTVHVCNQPYKERFAEFPDSVDDLVFKYNIYLSLEGWIRTLEHFNEFSGELQRRRR